MVTRVRREISCLSRHKFSFADENILETGSQVCEYTSREYTSHINYITIWVDDFMLGIFSQTFFKREC